MFSAQLNELAVSGTSSPVSVATGRALAYGSWYESTAAEAVVIPTPGASTRIDWIVLRKDWVLQTVRITRIAGVEGGAAPALTQVAGTTWDTPLAQASITTGGVITVTDYRQFVGSPRHVAKRKAATETVNNTDVLQNDDDFFFPIGPNEVWQVRIVAGADIKAASDFRFSFTLPAAAAIRMLGMVVQANTAQSVDTGMGTTPGTAVQITSANTRDMVYIDAMIVNGATGGMAQFQWAQRVAAVEDTSLLLNSSMVAHQID